MPEGSENSLNSNHERRLSVTCRYIDKLLTDMASILSVSSSRVAFPQYLPDLTSAQRRVVEDYIGRIRAQLIRVLDGQNIERPSADIPVGWSLHWTYMDAPVLPSRQSVMRKGEIAAVHSAFGCSFWLLALMECAWLAPRSLTRT